MGTSSTRRQRLRHPHDRQRQAVRQRDVVALFGGRQTSPAVVELRFFGGLSIEEAATLLELSPATIKRELTLAKAWLFRELEPK